MHFALQALLPVSCNRIRPVSFGKDRHKISAVVKRFTLIEGIMVYLLTVCVRAIVLVI